ncbi:uncharacterized protein LOC120008942 isoform X1 [Tripterygium wilfordii]|nr:uncharacterized protein LOC120008942 isoform X1 [Tripterygium wilfordii]XP_038715261.1 uncharacterized protein LOC120008942 isoform X1 [Tripterygium wilfordii]
MEGICCYYGRPYQGITNFKTVHGARCCSGNDSKIGTPGIVKVAVNGVTEMLRLLSSFRGNRMDAVIYAQRTEISVSSINDVLAILKSDYENAYFVTGTFTSAIYAEDCIFEDPTIRFQGTELYSRNLKLLVPFFDCPSIGLQKIEKRTDRPKRMGSLRIERPEGVASERSFVLARWKLRTYLKLPWKPLISIDGSTVYELDDEFKIVRHAESWNVSALEAIGQIFTPSFGQRDD